MFSVPTTDISIKLENKLSDRMLWFWNFIMIDWALDLYNSISTRLKDVLYMKGHIICIDITFILHCLMDIIKKGLTSYLSVF